MKKLIIYCLCALLYGGCQVDKFPEKTPDIENINVSDITESTAKCSFSIVPIGATQKAGVIYGLDLSLQSETSESSTTDLANENISLTLSDLIRDTTYYYKAYITDNKGTFIYSEAGQFKTKIFNVSTTSIYADYQA